MVKKRISNLKVRAVESMGARHVLLKLIDENELLPEISPGQFVNVLISGSSETFLRRPISINYVDKRANELWLLVAVVGKGTQRLAELRSGELLNIMLPLGKGFTVSKDSRTLLIGGGTGVAPLLFLGSQIREKGNTPTFLIGARNKCEIPELEMFKECGNVYVSTEDGTLGEQGLVTNHSIFDEQNFTNDAQNFTHIATCGPLPMMKAVSIMASKRGISCEVSLENVMACGIGACLCCVEKTTRGHICVCKEGPVFNTKDLLWHV